MTAIGAGGWHGRGVHGSTQTNLGLLPEAPTDFAFAALSEQRGFLGATVLLLLYLLVVWRGLRVVTLAPDLYGAVVAGGIVFALLFQIYVNVGMTMSIAPITGIPLPFVSVGGSSMIANLVAVCVAAGEPDDALPKRAHRANVPVVALAEDDVPHVLATDVVRLRAGHGFPLDEIARAIAGKLGERATPLAAHLPVLRREVCAELIADFARKNGILGAAVFVPGVDLPVLTLNQLRLVLRIAAAYGEDVDASRAPEIAGVVGSAFGWRALARELLDFVPVAGWAVKGAVAYA